MARLNKAQATIAILNSIINNLTEEEKDDGLDIYLRYAIACVKQDVAFIEDKGLKSTIMYMISDNYKERFKAEYKQLVIRSEKLRHTLNNMDISFNSSVELLKTQLNYMDAYAGVLRDRAKIEGIKLN